MLSLYAPSLMSVCRYKAYKERQHPICIWKIKTNDFSNADNNQEKGYIQIFYCLPILQ